MRTPALYLSDMEARNLEHILRQWKADQYGPNQYKYLLWRKVADVCNYYDNIEYRRLYGVGLPAQLRK